MKFKKLSFLCAALLLDTSLLFSADALLVRMSGNVEVLTGTSKGFQNASPGMGLKFGDTVQTSKDAKAQVLFSDGNAILIKESTTLKISGKPGAVLARVPQGEFLIGLKKRLLRGESFRVKTPAAIAAVRGTLFWGLSDQELNSTYACFQHELRISAGGKTIILKAGEKTFIPYGKHPGKIEQANVPIDYLDTFSVDGSIEGFKEMLEQK